MRILTLNVRGLKEVIKRKSIFEYCRQRADIICLQETHSECEDCKKMELEWGGKNFIFPW